MKSFKQYLDKPTSNLDELSKKHKVTVQHLEAQLKLGMKVEMEHTNRVSIAREIALDHLKENPNYYTRLKKVEK